MAEEATTLEPQKNQSEQLLETVMGVKITYLIIGRNDAGEVENSSQEISEKDYVTRSYGRDVKIEARMPTFSKELVKQLLQAREVDLLGEKSSLSLKESTEREENELKLTDCQRAISLMEQGRLTPDSLMSTTKDIVDIAKEKHTQTELSLKELLKESPGYKEKATNLRIIKDQNADRLLDFVANNAIVWAKEPQKTKTA